MKTQNTTYPKRSQNLKIFYFFEREKHVSLSFKHFIHMRYATTNKLALFQENAEKRFDS